LFLRTRLPRPHQRTHRYQPLQIRRAPEAAAKSPGYTSLPLADDYPRRVSRRTTNKRARSTRVTSSEILARTRAEGRGIAAYIAETLPSVGGQIVFPPDIWRRFTVTSARGRRSLHRGRSTGGIRTSWNAFLGIRNAGRGSRHRGSWQANRECVSARGCYHDAGDRQFI